MGLVKSIIAKLYLILNLFRFNFLNILLPGFVALYYLSLDVWGDTWFFFKNYESLHKIIFMLTISISLFLLVMRGIDDWANRYKENSFSFEESIVHNKFIGIFIPTFISIYYISIDVYGDKVDFFKNHQGIHSKIFTLLIITSLILLVLKGISEYHQRKTKEESLILANKLMTLLAKDIEIQIYQLKRKFKPLPQCRHIIKYDDNINKIFNDLEVILKFLFKINHFSISIIVKSSMQNKSYYIYSANSHYFKNSTTFNGQTVADIILNNKSTASHCLVTENPHLFIDKRSANKDNKYYFSDNDKKFNLIGSIYCCPIFVNFEENTYTYVFSISTYGKMLCETCSRKQVESIKVFFDQIKTLLELYLVKYTIYNKHYK